jgi:ceramide glucosyltransferase
MDAWLGIILLALSAIGLFLAAAQLAAVWWGERSAAPSSAPLPPISILKPLCGAETGLSERLAEFAALDYPDYEVVLGVRDTADTAYPIALAAVRRFAPRIRLALQRGEPGLNPKVNQLITLAANARHDLLVISDSNVHVGKDYLHDIAARFADPRVGLVSHPIVGAPSGSIGGTLDMLHLTTGIATGVLATKRIAGKDIVVGKSMAMRRSDLEALGGFAAVKDVLAEDFILGKMIPAALGKRVALSSMPVVNHSSSTSSRQFFKRYQRWSVIHRQAVGLPLYCGEILLNPIALCALALIANPRAWHLACGIAVSKMLVDVFAVRALTGRFIGLRALALVPYKDALIFAAWLYGLLFDRVDWRGNKLVVLPGTRLALPPEAEFVVEAVQ